MGRPGPRARTRLIGSSRRSRIEANDGVCGSRSTQGSTPHSGHGLEACLSTEPHGDPCVRNLRAMRSGAGSGEEGRRTICRLPGSAGASRRGAPRSRGRDGLPWPPRSPRGPPVPISSAAETQAGGPHPSRPRGRGRRDHPCHRSRCRRDARTCGDHADHPAFRAAGLAAVRTSPVLAPGRRSRDRGDDRPDDRRPLRRRNTRRDMARLGRTARTGILGRAAARRLPRRAVLCTVGHRRPCARAGSYPGGHLNLVDLGAGGYRTIAQVHASAEPAPTSTLATASRSPAASATGPEGSSQSGPYEHLGGHDLSPAWSSPTSRAAPVTWGCPSWSMASPVYRLV